MDKRMHRLKIAYFIDRLIKGGTELQLVGQINWLAKYGIEQEIFCLYKSTEHDKFNLNCKVNVIGIRRLLSVRTLQRVINVGLYLKRRGFTIVQTYFFDSTVVGILSGKMARIPILLSCRRDLGFWYTPLLLFNLKLLNKLTDRLLVNCKAAAETLVEKEGVHPGKIVIVRNGIDCEKYRYPLEERERNRRKLGLKEGDICAGIIANMSREVKRVDLFIKMAEYIVNKNKCMKFLILGEGYLKNNLIDMTKRLGLGRFIRFLNRSVSKHNVLSSMDIGVLTSDSEAFSNAVMEYMAAGLPTVATDVGGNRELIEDMVTGYLVPHGDFKSLGEMVIQLANDRDLRRKMGSRAKKAIKKYDWNIQARVVLHFYVNLLRGKCAI